MVLLLLLPLLLFWQIFNNFFSSLKTNATISNIYISVCYGYFRRTDFKHLPRTVNSQIIRSSFTIQVVSFFFFLDLFIYLFIICKYTVAVFRHSRRGRQISFWMIVSHHVVARIWTQDLQKSSWVLLPTEPSHQPAKSLFFKTVLDFTKEGVVEQ
jgi:hypothetical protein